MNKGTIAIIGSVATIIGAIASIVGGVVTDKKIEMTISEKVNEAVANIRK